MKNILPSFLKFSNGLSLILQTMLSVHSVAIYVAVRAGPRYETKETSGLAHFLEHMLFEGTKNLPSSKEVAQSIEQIGGKSSAWTDKEHVVYWAKVPKEYLELVFNHLSDILFNSLLSNEAIEKEKRIIMEELKRQTDNPEVEIWDSFLEWIWGKNQSLGHSTLGDETSINNVRKAKLQEYLNKLYHSANMAIAVVGNFSLKQATGYAKKYFGDKKTEDVPRFERLSFTPKKIRTKIIKVAVQQVHLILGFVTNVSYEHRDRFPMIVLADILGTGVSSRLFHRLVYEAGIAYTTGVSNWFFSDTGLFYAYGGFAPENVERAIKIILEELDKLKRVKVSRRELKETKEKSKSQLYFSLETPDAIASLYATQQIIEGQIMTPDELSNKIDRVTAEEIQRVARQYLNANNICLIIRGPLNENKAKSIEKLFG